MPEQSNTADFHTHGKIWLHEDQTWCDVSEVRKPSIILNSNYAWFNAVSMHGKATFIYKYLISNRSTFKCNNNKNKTNWQNVEENSIWMMMTGNRLADYQNSREEEGIMMKPSLLQGFLRIQPKCVSIHFTCLYFLDYQKEWW